ncbi:MAG: glycosyltransferase family 4 protein [Candidatus Omnitrophica bacterium]|nr:glycosyltransferase family 4 protein [Candidatus Omnitrophota bacterium]
MHRIKLLFVVTKLELGGAQKQLLSLIAHLNKERFHIFLFVAQEGLLLSEALSIKGITIIKSRCLERAINPIKDLLVFIEVYWVIKKNNIEIVHTHSSKAGILGRLAARLAKVGIIIHTVHGWSFNDYQPALVRGFFIWLERFSARFTHKIIVVSHYDKQKGLNNRIGKEDRYELIRYGIDYKEFSERKQNIRQELGINTRDLVVAMVACFKPQKSPMDFIKLSFLVKKSLPNVKFVLVGDGILREEIEKLICKLNLEGQVFLTGWRRDIPRILSAIDAFVLTSLWEGLPITVLEAMASSKPVVATHTGGIQEIVVEGKTGFLVSPRNMELMSEQLIILLKNEELRRQMGQRAIESLDFNFSLENMVNSTKTLYETVVSQNSSLYAN